MPPNPHSTPLGREARNKTHTETQTNITHTTTNNGIQRTEKTLGKKNDSPTGDAVQQDDQQGHNGPEQGGSTAAPEEQS